MSRLALAARPLLAVASVSVAVALIVAPSVDVAAGHPPQPGPLHGRALVTSPPQGSSGPDDITSLAIAGVDHGHLVIWTAYQNGISPTGSPPGAQSTVAGYDAHSGHLVETIAVTGKVDGLVADANRLVATVNEDANSALDLIDVSTGGVTTYSYSPTPEVSGNGGTDSIAIWHGGIYVAHSNPNDTTQPATYSVHLDGATHTADLRPLYFCDSSATDAVSGATAPLGLTDPDSNAVVPDEAPRFAGQLAQISQGDGQIVFAASATAPSLTLLNLADAPTPAFPNGESHPPIDGFAVATAGRGTLYVVDATAGTITALDTKDWPAGTVFVGEPSDNGNPLIGTLNLSTGAITPLRTSFVSPKGLLFVPAPGT